MKIIKINSKERTVEVVELRANTKEDDTIQAKHMRELIGCNYFEHTVLGGNVDMWFDEEFLLHEQHEFYGFALPDGQPILGNAIITSFDEEGNTIGLENPKEVAEFIYNVIIFGQAKDKEEGDEVRSEETT
jgi:hypothetical protein